jgi:hypothetical protein
MNTARLIDCLVGPINTPLFETKRFQHTRQDSKDCAIFFDDAKSKVKFKK